MTLLKSLKLSAAFVAAINQAAAINTDLSVIENEAAAS